MIFHQIAGDAAQGFLHRSDLYDDVGAIAVFANHFLQAANLAFNAAQALLIALLQFGIDSHGPVAGANFTRTLGGASMGRGFRGSHQLIPSRGIYTPTPYQLSRHATAPDVGGTPCATRGWYTTAMTLLEIRYALASPLSNDQLRQLGEFANTYGLRKFHLNETKTELSFEYDASRLRETQVEHVLAQAKIAVAKRLN